MCWVCAARAEHIAWHPGRKLLRSRAEASGRSACTALTPRCARKKGAKSLDVAQAKDGSLLYSEDGNCTIWRVARTDD
jgi:glucose/arabinose dehydrogenase